MNAEALADDLPARDLFMRFPLPLAIVGPTGEARLINDSFEAVLDRHCLDTQPLRELIAAADEQWHAIGVSSAEGNALNLRAQARSISRGVLLVLEDTPSGVTESELANLKARITELERRSSTDGLTGIWNRGHFDRVLEVELSRSLRFRQPISLLMLDVDHFKVVNDTHGHATGDAMLRALVHIVRASVRASDELFRWGGEEFVVLAPGTGFRGAEALAENLRRVIETHDFPVVERLTVSLGVAEHLATESADAWFARVDAALYAAKRAGRNRVHTARTGSSDLWAAEDGNSALRLVWQEAYECGEPSIDAEHRELFDLANQAIAASIAGKRDATLAGLDELFAHTEAHFRDEERLLEQRAYPRLAAHARAHAKLLKRAVALRAAVASGEAKTADLVDFLAVEVVAQHLFTMDRDFFPLFASTP